MGQHWTSGLSRASVGRLFGVGLVTLALLLAPSHSAWPAVAEAAPSTPSMVAPVPGEIVVQPKPGRSIDAVNTRYGLRVLFQFTDSTSALVSTSDLNGVLARLAHDPDVEWFEANNTARQPAAKEDSGSDPYCGPVTSPTGGATAREDSGSDPFCTSVVPSGRAAYASQWLDARIGLTPALRQAQGRGITIAVLDTAVETAHPALAGRLLRGIDVVPLDPQSDVPTTGSKRGHGTFVAGIALHVAPAANVLPVRVLNDDGRGSTSLVAEGIRRAAKAGAQVINMSLSTPTPARAMREAVAYAEQRGAILIAAYGNEGLKQPPVYPATFTNVVSVVATDRADVLARFTNYGNKADVAAPGVNVVGPWRDGQYGIGSGTSYAAPVVAGEAALLLSGQHGMAPSTVRAQIVSKGDNIAALNGGWPGFLRVNLSAALGIKTSGGPGRSTGGAANDK